MEPIAPGSRGEYRSIVGLCSVIDVSYNERSSFRCQINEGSIMRHCNAANDMRCLVVPQCAFNPHWYTVS